MRKAKFRFNSSTVSTADVPIPGAADKECDDGLTRKMDKFPPAVTKPALSAQDGNVSLATNYDLASLEQFRDLRSITGQERLEAYEAPKVQFIDEDGPTSPLPMFVTRTTLVALFADEQGNDADAGANQAH